MSERTAKQRAGSARNAAAATAARSAAAAERRGDLEQVAVDVYAPVVAALDRAVGALEVDRALAVAHARHALLLLAKVGGGPGFNLARSRSIAASLKAAFGSLQERP